MGAASAGKQATQSAVDETGANGGNAGMTPTSFMMRGVLPTTTAGDGNEFDGGLMRMQTGKSDNQLIDDKAFEEMLAGESVVAKSGN